ncbi:MAG TPA: hypothetical protein VMI75_26510 [Polyangiaceae bacterium]|nr:hypothetical protein [Polyangiaceae bacterium]
MRSKLMPLAAASALLVSFACGCAMETGGEEETSADPAAAPVDEKTGTTEEAQDVDGYPLPGHYGRQYFARLVYGIPYGIPPAFGGGQNFGMPLGGFGYGMLPPF